MSGDETTPERLKQLIRQLETTATEAHTQLRTEVDSLEDRNARLTDRLDIQAQELTELQRKLIDVQRELQETQRELVDLRRVAEKRRDE